MHNERTRHLPHRPGVYLMRDAAGTIIYVGKAKDIKRRVSSYFRADVGDKAAAIISSMRRIDYLLASSEREALILERQLINQLKPYFNAMWRDDKSYPWLRLSHTEDFPRLELTRTVAPLTGEYFGPYPQVSQVKHLMRWLQRVFKWRPCRLPIAAGQLPPRHKIISCLYAQTGRCLAPCRGTISPAAYRRSLLPLRLYLTGKFKKLERRWEREMQEASSRQLYEVAADIRDRIRALHAMHEKVQVREIHVADIPASLTVTGTLEELQRVCGLQRLPAVVECFDISHISGAETVGSMVRFLNARPDTAHYRKYRLSGSPDRIDDPAMIAEIVLRRYRRLCAAGAPLPDLVLIDGGRLQLAAALQSLHELKVPVPVIALAKQEEEIYLSPDQPPLRLPRNSPALRLLQHARDEAHRFAVSYHRTRRRMKLNLQPGLQKNR